ncbi:MAG: Nucleoporin nup84 [Chaenotheca gracillima]|nr:MAG: Nucleoporin nup84 [Chaenotheca gracillima]
MILRRASSTLHRTLLRGRCGGLKQCHRVFSQTSKRLSYEDTIPNLKIGKHTKATANAQQSLEWGTRIVGGVTPGKDGEHLGLPVLPTVRAAKEQLQPDATGVFVAAQYAGKAIEEAIEAEIPLIVAVAEHIPLHDILRIHSMLQTQSKSRLVGANCPGIVSPVGKCRIGFQPLPCFSPGKIGIVAKSGTLSYEAVASTSRAGLGQSLVIGMGGDIVAGTSLVDGLKVFEHDDDTEGIALVGEVGGRAEEDAAEWIREYRKRTANPKPIAALVAGIHAVTGRVMGHAGAFASPGEANAQTKIQTLEDAGVQIVSHPAQFGPVMKQLLSSAPGSRVNSGSVGPVYSQKRGMHSLTGMRRPVGKTKSSIAASGRFQQRTLYINQNQAFRLLQDRGISTTDSSEASSMLLAISIDRTKLAPCVIAAPAQSTEEDIYLTARKFPFDYQSVQRDLQIPQVSEIARHLRLDSKDTAVSKKLAGLMRELLGLFYETEAFSLETRLLSNDSRLLVQKAKFGFDDAAYRSARRREDVHKLRNVQEEDPAELEAEKHGIVYIKLAGNGNIGTLVNGAGLAMNTNDALASHGGKSANFLDTGGKATSETVKESFKLITSDPRVKVVFVNIFGGLTLCDMIANGIMLAFKELEMRIPVVVRLRGTNEELGQKMIAESGLPLHAFDDFDEAAAKAISLAESQ